MKTLLIIMLSILAPTVSHARIGESREQCVARYGQPVSEDKTGRSQEGTPDLVFVKSGIRMSVWIGPQGVDQIRYQKVAVGADKRPVRFSEDEINMLLTANMGAGFQEVRPGIPENRNWANEQNTLWAVLVGNQGLGPYFLEIQTSNFQTRLQADSAKRGAAALQGL